MRPTLVPQIAVDTILRTEQLAEMLGLTPRTLERWRRDGLGPAVLTLGRSVRYRLSDVNFWLAQNVHTAKEAA